MVGRKAAEAETAACVPIRDSATGPTPVEGRSAQPAQASLAVQPPALAATEAEAARAGPTSLAPSQRPSSVGAAAPARVTASVREPLRPLQLPRSSMAAFAASPAPLPQPTREPTGPGAFGASCAALLMEGGRAAAQGQVAHHPGVRQDTFLPEEAVRFRPDLTSIGQAGRQVLALFAGWQAASDMQPLSGIGEGQFVSQNLC